MKAAGRVERGSLDGGGAVLERAHREPYVLRDLLFESAELGVGPIEKVAVGGELLFVESASMPGKGRLQ